MHALAIGRAGPDAAAAMDGLWNAGYQSILRVEEVSEAPGVLACFRPDLILVLADAAQPESMRKLRRMARKADAPIVVTRGDVERALDCLGPATSTEPPRWLPPHRPSHMSLAA